MVDGKALAKEVHALLLEAKPHRDDDNLAKAAKLASRGRPSEAEHPQTETYFAIMKVNKAIAADASGVDAEGLLRHAITAAQKWAAG